MAARKKDVKRAGKPLEFSGGLTHLQWCAGTLHNLEDEARKSKAQLTTQHSCVVNLVGGLRSECMESVQAVCLVLVEAVSRGLISGDSVISSLTSSCASMPHWTLSVYTIAKILRIKVASSVQKYGSFTCPYSLRSSPHPFISIFNSKPESGLVISDVAVQMLKESNNCFDSVLGLLTPLLKYLFLHPCPSPDHQMVSSQLHPALLTLTEAQLVGEERQPTLLLQTLTDFISLSPTATPQNILTLSNHLERLTVLWCKVGDSAMVCVMVDACLALSCKMLEMSLSFDSLLNCIFNTATSLKMNLCSHHICCLSWLMLKSMLLPSTVNIILHLVMNAVKVCPQLLSSATLLLLPLVQLLSLPHTSDHDTKTALTLTQSIQDNSHCLSLSSGKIKSLKCLLEFQPYSMIKSFCSDTLPNVLSSPDAVEAWLNHISDENHISNIPSSTVEVLALTISAFLAGSMTTASDCGGSQVPLILRALCTLVKSHSNISPGLLPLILYLLPLAPSPSLKLSLVNSLPLLTTHRLAVNPTANTLRTLAGNVRLLPLSLSLLGKLWDRYDSVFPHIVALLSQHNNSVPVEILTEFDIAKSIVIKEICSKRGEQHGEDILGHISVVFKQSKVPLAVALVTDALASLCQCDVVDPVTVWSVFGEKLVCNDSVPVAVASCSVLALAASVECDQRHSAKVFKDAALTQLWKMAFSKDHEVCSAALDGLSNFTMTDFLVEHLPPEAPQVPSVTPDTMFDVDPEPPPLPPSYCADLVTTIPEQSLWSLSQLLSSLLVAEVEGIPRGTITSAVRQSTVVGSLERAVGGLGNMVQGLCLANAVRDSLYGMVASTTLMLHGTMSSSTDLLESRGRGGHTATREVKKCTVQLEEALQQCRVCLDFDDMVDGVGVLSAVSCLTLGRQWASFMKKICDTFSKAWLLRNCPSSILDDSSALGDKLFKARDWAKKEVVVKLTDTLKNSPMHSANVYLSLVGVVGAPLPSLSGNSEPLATVEPASPWSSVDLLQLMMTHTSNILSGSDSPPSVDNPLSSLLSSLRESVDSCVIPLSTPVLVETALNYSTSDSHTLSGSLENLVLSLWRHFNESPSWYGGIVVNEILLMMLPRMTQAESITAELVHFAEASQKSESFDFLSVMSALVPVLCVVKHTEQSLTLVTHLRALLDRISSDQLTLHPVQIVCLNYVNSCRFLYLSGLLSDDEAMEHVTHIADLATKAPHVAVYHYCLGSLMYGLMAASHSTVQQLADAVAVRWIQQLSDHTSPNKLLALMWGLTGLTGVSPTFEMMWYKAEVVPLTFIESLFPLLKDTLVKLSSDENGVVVCHATWLLGHIYHTLTATFTTIERGPKDYSYLPEHSLLPTLFSHLSNLNDVGQVNCLLSVLLSTNNQLPPCNFSPILFPFIRQSELQLRCIELMVKQGSLVGMKTLASHTFNMILTSNLETEAGLAVLENLSSLLQLVPAWQYLQPLTSSLLQQYPTSQKQLQSYLKGLKGVVVSGSSANDVSSVCGEMVRQVWEKICSSSRSSDLLHNEGKLLLGVLADSLAAIEYTLILFEVSLPVSRTVFECLLLCVWVKTGKHRVSDLTKIIHWTLQNLGLLDGELLAALMEGLVEAMRHTSSVATSSKSLAMKTELMHSLLAWTRATEVSALQMYWVLFLSVAVCSPTSPNLSNHFSHDLEQWLASFSLPYSPVLQEKLLQCIVEWFSHSDTEIHQICLNILERFTLTKAYSSPILWTTAAHHL